MNAEQLLGMLESLRDQQGFNLAGFNVMLKPKRYKEEFVPAEDLTIDISDENVPGKFIINEK